MHKILRKKTIGAALLGSVLFGSNELTAQQYYQSTEFGLGVGGSHYFGDLNPNFGFKQPALAFTALYRKNFNPYISISGNLTYTRIGYKDAYSDNFFQKSRNLSFHSNILELAAVGEFNFFWFETGDQSKRWTPYLSLGLSAFYFEPMADINGTNHKLRLLGTEGQNLQQYKDRKYSNIAWAVPVGAGIKWWVAPGVNMSFEIVNRFTQTDYLDDVSKTYVGIENFYINPGVPTIASMLQDPSALVDGQKIGVAGKKRGDESTRDQFVMALFKMTFQLKTYKCPKFENNMWQGSQVSY